MSSTYLWPRQEVFQLILPQLAQAGRLLNSSLVLGVIKELSRAQTPDEHGISFDRWLVVTKNILEWNNNCICLFWEMLQLAIACQYDEFMCSTTAVDLIELEYIAIFLILHIPENGSRITSPMAAYDTSWPFPDGLDSNSGGGIPKSPLSPTQQARTNKYFSSSMSATGGNMSSINSLSPRSPTSQRNGAPTSPKRSHLLSPRQSSRTNSQLLQSLKNKLPLILQALSVEGLEADRFPTEMEAAVHDGGSGIMTGSLESGLGIGIGLFDNSTIDILGTFDFSISRRSLDCLGLIICGGSNKDESVGLLSILFPGISPLVCALSYKILSIIACIRAIITLLLITLSHYKQGNSKAHLRALALYHTHSGQSRVYC